MVSRLKKIWGHLSVKIVLGILIAIIPLNIIAIQSMINMNQQMRDSTRYTIQNISDVYAASLNAAMDRADRYMYNLLNKESYGIEMREQSDTTDYMNGKIWSTRDMNDNLPVSEWFCGHYVYLSEKEELAYSSTTGHIQQSASMKNYLNDNIALMENQRKWTVMEVDNIQYLFHIVRNNGIIYGSFIDITAVLNEISDSIHYTDYSVTYVDKKEVSEQPNEVIVNTAFNKSIGVLCIKIENVNIFGTEKVWEKIQQAVIILCLACAPFMFAFLRKHVIKPLNQLNKAHYQIEIGNWDYRITDKASSMEINHAFQSFNQMAENMKDLRLENMQKELEKQKVELNNLQLQIRPHFLLNTFNLMFNLTSKGDMKSIQSLILYLSDYFRYIFRSGKDLELFDKELKLIKGYMESVKLRYPDRIDMVYSIDPEISLVRVPPLLIHNFVENIIKHALKSEGTLYIILCATYEDRVVTFQISDDGNGMSQDEMDYINRGEFVKEPGSHVGLANSYKRLKYFYGDTASIHVDSELNVGTMFTVSFPYDLEEC